jgi:hypothetical protein
VPEWLTELLAAIDPGGQAVSGLFTDTAAFSMIVGVVSPWLIALVQQPQWSTKVRKLVAVAASVVLGVLTSIATGSFADGPVSIAGACAIVLVASQSTYKTLAQPSSGRMRTETATSPKRRRRKRKPTQPPPADGGATRLEDPAPPPPPDEPEYAEPLGPDSVTVEQILRREGRPGVHE